MTDEQVSIPPPLAQTVRHETKRHFVDAEYRKATFSGPFVNAASCEQVQGAYRMGARGVNVAVALIRAAPSKSKPWTFIAERCGQQTYGARVFRSDKLPKICLSVATALPRAHLPCHCVEFRFRIATSHGEGAGVPACIAGRSVVANDDEVEPRAVVVPLPTSSGTSEECVQLTPPSFLLLPTAQDKPVLLKVAVLAIGRDCDGRQIFRQLWKTCPVFAFTQRRALEPAVGGVSLQAPHPRRCYPGNSSCTYRAFQVIATPSAGLACLCPNSDGCGCAVVTAREREGQESQNSAATRT